MCRGGLLFKIERIHNVALRESDRTLQTNERIMVVVWKICFSELCWDSTTKDSKGT